MQQQYSFKIPFNLHLPQYTDPNTRLFISGNANELGNWINSMAKPIKMGSPGLWSAIIQFDVNLNHIEWKWIEIRSVNSQQIVVWQEGFNNIINLTSIQMFKDHQQEQKKIKIVSFNVRYQNNHDGLNKWKHRRDAVFDIIKKQDADFVGLQEVLQEQGENIMKVVGHKYGYIGRGRDKNPAKGEASPILYNKFLWVPIFNQIFWLSATPLKPSLCFKSDLPRIATVAIFQNKFQPHYQVMLVNTHFDLDQECRERSVDVLLEILTGIIDKYKVREMIMMGDLNCQFDNQAVKRLFDNFKFIKFAQLDKTTYHDFKGTDFKEFMIIDHIFYSGNQYGLQSYKVHSERPECLKNINVHPSDHYPIVCILNKN